MDYLILCSLVKNSFVTVIFFLQNISISLSAKVYLDIGTLARTTMLQYRLCIA